MKIQLPPIPAAPPVSGANSVGSAYTQTSGLTSSTGVNSKDNGLSKDIATKSLLLKSLESAVSSSDAFDQAKVNAITNALTAGTFTMNSMNIANNLTDSTALFLN